MALHFSSIPYKEQDFIKRIDPKYYQLQEALSFFKGDNRVSICEFGTIITNITDGEHAGQNFISDGVLFLKNSSVKDYDISVNDGFYISPEDHNRLSRSAVKSGDILFTTIGHLGSAAIVPENFCEANMNQNFVKIRVNNKINPYYLVCFLNGKFSRKQINALLTGNIQSILTYPKIKNIKILYPINLDEQLVIADKYKKALRLSQLAEKNIETALSIFEETLDIDLRKKDYSKVFSVSYDEFYNNSLWTTKSHLPKYVRMEEEIKNKHPYITLDKIVIMNKGDEPGSSAYSSYLDKTDDDIPFIRTSDIYNYQIDLSPDNFVDTVTYNELAQDVIPGDILFTKDGKIAEVAMVTNSDIAVYQSGITIIRINEYGRNMGLTQEYIFAAMMCKKIGKYTAERYTVTASTIPHLKEHYIGEMIIPIFTKEKIKTITKYIREAYTYIENKKVLIRECQNLINDITSRYFK